MRQSGDILTVSEAVVQDGTSHRYLPNCKTVKSDKKLLHASIDYCESKGYSYLVGSVFSTSAMLLETQEMISEWALNGHKGVDMETAATLVVARRYGKKAIGLLNLSDHLIAGDTLYSYPKERELIEAITDEKIRDVALYLSSISVKFK